MDNVENSLHGWQIYNSRTELNFPDGAHIDQVLAKMPQKSIYIDYVYTQITGLPSRQITIEIIKTDKSNGGYVKCTSIWDGNFWIGYFGATNTVQGWTLFEGTSVLV